MKSLKQLMLETRLAELRYNREAILNELSDRESAILELLGKEKKELTSHYEEQKPSKKNN